MMRQLLSSAADSHRLRDWVTQTPWTANVAARFVGGQTLDTAIGAARRIVASGTTVSYDHLGEHVGRAEEAVATRKRYEELISALVDAGLAAGADLSVKLSSLGLGLDPDGPDLAVEHAEAIAQAAQEVGATVTVDMEDYPSVAPTLAVVHRLREQVPSVGVAVQAALRRTQDDCQALAQAGARVRLCKGAYVEPAEVSFPNRQAVDRSYVRCLRVLMAGSGYPMVATHDPRLIEIAGALAIRYQRPADGFEYQMLYGVRPAEQVRLARSGHRVRVYLPYGEDWYPYLVRRLAERPANLLFFLRSLATRA